MKKQIVLITAIFVMAIFAIIVMPNNVFAAFPDGMSEEFKEILNEEGKLVVTDSSLSDDNFSLVVNHISKLRNLNLEYYFETYVVDSNDTDCSVVEINRIDAVTYQTLESYNIDVVYKDVYSEEFKKAITDITDGNANIVITSTAINLTKEQLFLNHYNAYIASLNTEQMWFEYADMDENYTQCTIKLFDENNQIKEQHIVNISYVEKFSEKFKTMTEDGNLVIPFTNNGEKSNLIDLYIGDNELFSYQDLNEDATKCTLYMYEKVEDGDWIQLNVVETHIVNIVYEEKFSNEFQKFTTDGNIVITSSTAGEKVVLIEEYCSKFSEMHVLEFQYDDLNEDATKCTITMYEYEDLGEGGYVGTPVESHIVNISYEEEFSDEFSALLNEDGKFVFNSIKPAEEWDWYTLFEMQFMEKVEGISPNYLAEDFSSADITINYGTANQETHNVQIVYNYDKTAQEQIKAFVNNFPKDIEYFAVQDMELINYWVNNVDNEDIDTFLHYSSEYKKYLNHSNLDFYVMVGAGADYPVVTEAIGMVAFVYDGTIIHTESSLGTKGNHIIYVPDNTGNSKEELMAAAQKRVNEYIGANKVEIKYENTKASDIYLEIKNEYDEYLRFLEEYLYDLKNAPEYTSGELEWVDEEIAWVENEIEYYKNSAMKEFAFLEEVVGDYTFSVNIPNKDGEIVKHTIVIVKDSSKMITPTHKTVEMSTNIEVSSTSSSVPLDALIEAEKLTSGTEYERIIKILDVENSEMFDIKLYSNSLSEYITKLEDGKFEVKIPISENLKGKTLIVYYVDENGKVTPHDVTPQDGYAVFTTDHFSIYTLAEKVSSNTGNENDGEEGTKPGEDNKEEDSNNNGSESTGNLIINGSGDTLAGNSNATNNGNKPETGDNILLFVSLLFASIVGLAVMVKKNYKK